MKTSRKEPSTTQQIFNFVLALGLMTLLLAPASAAQAQAGGPPAPLFPRLAWTDLGAVERAFTVNGESVTLPGNAYQAEAAFNLEASPEITAYYSTRGMAQSGWQEVDTASQSNGTTAVYFHSGGAFAVVEFVGCETDPTLACLSVWQSYPSEIVPSSEARVQPQATGTVSKSSPANGANNVDTTVTLSWAAYTGTGLNRYRYCIDTTNNSECDAAGNWTNAWSARSVTVSGLQQNTRYYWQVQAVLNDDTKVDANGGSWWSFTTKVGSTTPPGAFNKTLPANGATGQSITPTLVWQASASATSYEYCVDTVNNNFCDSNWVSTNNTFVTLMTGIGANIQYYWQVRAVNTANTTYANGGSWFAFRTAVGPANDTIDSAAVISAIPSESILNTTAATLDTGTTNPCSPSLGLASVWYRYSATADRRLYIDTFGSSYNTFIAVWARNANGTLSLITCNDDSGGTAQSNVNLAVTNGSTYYIQVAQRNSGSATVATPGGVLNFHVRTFADVTANNPFWKTIEGLYAAGITGGCSAGPDQLFCPTGLVDRASMAVFLLKGIHGAAYNPPAVGTTTGFADVPVTFWAAAWIKQLAAEGITLGCGGGNFCPNAPVTRAQMAVFLLRSKHGASYNPPAVGSGTGFTDVPTTYWAAAWVKQLAAEGITTGCGANLYCPETNVTREQMSAFLSRTFNIAPRP